MLQNRVFERRDTILCLLQAYIARGNEILRPVLLVVTRYCILELHAVTRYCILELHAVTRYCILELLAVTRYCILDNISCVVYIMYTPVGAFESTALYGTRLRIHCLDIISCNSIHVIYVKNCISLTKS